MLELVKENDPILRTPCPEFDFGADDYLTEILTEYLSQLTADMLQLMAVSNGIGLAAPQVGLNRRIFVMCIDEEEFICINPKIIENGPQDVVYEEGCLSFPELMLKVGRSERINVCYQTVDGTEITKILIGIASRCFQHELDHVNGVTFDTKVSKFSLKLAKDKRSKLLKTQSRRGL